MKENQFNWNSGNGNNTNLLRISVVFLSVVSFFTTANGMSEYIFTNNYVIAYAASAAIQGILLALSMNLPGYLQNIREKPEQPEVQMQSGKNNKIVVFLKYQWGNLRHFLTRTFLRVCVILLTFVTIFCSTWFSYIYIADIIHQDSWETESELLVQQTYRTELYHARDYAHAYRIYLEEDMGEQILLLDKQTGQLSNPDPDFMIDWDEEKETYVESDEAEATGYMSTVINATERALKEDATQEERAFAAMTITDAKANIADRMENIQQNIEILDVNGT